MLCDLTLIVVYRSFAVLSCSYAFGYVGRSIEPSFRSEKDDDNEVDAKKNGTEPFTPSPAFIYWLCISKKS